jgi:hypothetical protein
MVSSSTALAEDQIDNVLANSFPASDPPSWTPGSAETEFAVRPAAPVPFGTPAGVLRDVSRADGTPATSRVRSYLRRMTALLGASGLALLLPLFIVFLPLALLYRLVLDVAGWPRWPSRQRVSEAVHG